MNNGLESANTTAAATAAVVVPSPPAARLPSAGDALRRPTNNGSIFDEDVDVLQRLILGPQRQISSVSASVDWMETKAERDDSISTCMFSSASFLLATIRE